MTPWLATTWKHQRLPILVGVAWLVMVIVTWFISQRTGTTIPTCLFRRFTGQPCATCGGTRAGMRLLHADVPGALAFNPLVTAVLLGLPVWAVVRVWRGPRPAKSRRARTAWGAAWLIALGANWAYVLWHERTLQNHAAQSGSP
jgi:hypothetical protein